MAQVCTAKYKARKSMFRRLVEGFTGENFTQEPPAFDSKESKECHMEPDYSQRTTQESDRIWHIIALPNDRLLMQVRKSGKCSIEIYDIHTKSFIKKIEIEKMKSCKLLSDKELAIQRYDNNALIYDLDLNYLATLKPSDHLSQLVRFNDDIIIGFDRNERNNEIFTRSDTTNTYGSSSKFLDEVGYDKIGFLTPLGNNKILAAHSCYYLRVIESKDGLFKRIGWIDFNAKDERIYSASKISDDRFAVVSSVSNTIFTKVKKEEVLHLRIYDTNTLQCIEDIILPKSAPVRKIKMLPDGKTAIGWDPLMKPHEIYEINLETHAQKTIPMPERVIGLTVLSNGNIVVLLDFKKILEVELEQIKQFKKEARQEIALKAEDSTTLVKNVADIVASYSDGDVSKLPLQKHDEINGEALKEEISQKIKSLSNQKSQFFIDDELNILRACQSFLEKNLCDEKEFVAALSFKKGIHNAYADKVLAVIKAQNTSKRVSGWHLKN